jgi:aspartate carbamoyltransferase regulatory subunit
MTINSKVKTCMIDLYKQLQEYEKIMVITFCPPDIVINEIRCLTEDLSLTDNDLKISDSDQSLLIPLATINLVNNFKIQNSSTFQLYQNRIDPDLLYEMTRYKGAIILQTKNKNKMQILMAIDK